MGWNGGGVEGMIVDGVGDRFSPSATREGDLRVTIATRRVYSAVSILTDETARAFAVLVLVDETARAFVVAPMTFAPFIERDFFGETSLAAAAEEVSASGRAREDLALARVEVVLGGAGSREFFVVFFAVESAARVEAAGCFFCRRDRGIARCQGPLFPILQRRSGSGSVCLNGGDGVCMNRRERLLLQRSRLERKLSLLMSHH